MYFMAQNLDIYFQKLIDCCNQYLYLFVPVVLVSQCVILNNAVPPGEIGARAHRLTAFSAIC